MRIFGYTIIVSRAPVISVPADTPITPAEQEQAAFDRLAMACDELTSAWWHMRTINRAIAPWIVWQDKKVVVSERRRSGETCIIYDPMLVEYDDEND